MSTGLAKIESFNKGNFREERWRTEAVVGTVVEMLGWELAVGSLSAGC